MPTLEAIASDTDRAAEDLEDHLRRLALLLFALELALMSRAIARAQGDVGVVDALRAAVVSYRAPNGIFRREWEERFTQLLSRSARETSRQVLPVVGRGRVTAPLPPSTFRVIETQAAELAAQVTQVSAAKIEAVLTAVRQASTDRVVGGSLVASRAAQRLETLVPLVGRDAATEIMKVVTAGHEAGRSLKRVATELTEQVHSTEITATRAERIARNESMGLVNAVEYERAIGTGVLREKRWIHQNDSRVRDSHIRCGAEGWIPLNSRFSNGLLHPHERPAPASEVMGCRCSQAFRA